MRTHHIFLTISVLSIFLFFSCSKNARIAEQRMEEVVVYAYDSFISEWGAGPAIAKGFEAKTGYTLTFVNCGDAAQVLSKAILENGNPQSDMLLGIDNNIAQKARDENVLEQYKPLHADEIISDELRDALGGDWMLTPYDYSKFALIYDTYASVPAPKSLADLTKPVYAKKLILMDPRMSTPGLGFAAWTVAFFGNEYESYWRKLKSAILTMSPGWSSGYGLFTKGEAPLVISYVTSPAYHVYADNSTRYKALVFDEGHVQQVEGAGITKGAANSKGAKAFLDYLISDEAQSELPIGQWMYPVNKNVVLPDCYAITLDDELKTLSYDGAVVAEAVTTIAAILAE
ncbi:MAG: thiamine ABC transporter substrate-binding protein [Treponema sp.]|nr:thiamine ABC transporter substrate-binding protein [Treponema sp.]